MDMDFLTLGEFKQKLLADDSVVRAVSETNAHPFVGKYVMCRCFRQAFIVATWSR